MTRLDADGSTVADRIGLRPVDGDTHVVLEGYTGTGSGLTVFVGSSKDAEAYKANLVEVLESLVEAAVSVVRAAS